MSKLSVGQPVFVKGEYQTPFRITQQLTDGRRIDCQIVDCAGNMHWEYEEDLEPMRLNTDEIKRLNIRRIA